MKSFGDLNKKKIFYEFSDEISTRRFRETTDVSPTCLRHGEEFFSAEIGSCLCCQSPIITPSMLSKGQYTWHQCRCRIWQDKIEHGIRLSSELNAEWSFF